MKLEQIDYPALADNPEYQAESQKLLKFLNAHANAEKERAELQQAWLDEKAAKANQSEADRIAEADAFVSGTADDSNLPERIESNRRLLESLRRGIQAQRTAVDRVVEALSVKAAERFREEHKVRAARILEVVRAVQAANLEEIALRNHIEALGYAQRLPCLRFEPPQGSIDPADPYGGYAPAWARDVEEYVQDPATKARKSKFAALIR